MFYAAYHTAGPRFTNDVQYVYRFRSQVDRDAFVDIENRHELHAWGQYKTVKCSRETARQAVPKAFNPNLNNEYISQWAEDCMCIDEDTYFTFESCHR